MADIIQLTETPAHLLSRIADAKDEHTPSHGDLSEASDGIKQQILKEQIVETLSTIYDPEIPVNIYELGLIYDLQVDAGNNVDVKMTLTSPACPVAGSLPGEVEQKVQAVPGVNSARVELVWDPPYTMDMMSEAAQLKLGLL